MENRERPRSDAEPIGARIRRLRHERGLTLREVAEAGVSFSHLSRIENGDRFPSIQVIRAIARKLGVKAEYLEHGAELSTHEALELALVDAELRLRLEPEDADLRADLTALIDRAIREGDHETAARAQGTRGMFEAGRGRIPEAIADLESAVQHPLVGPDAAADAYLALLRAYDAVDRTDEAIALCERALARLHRDDRSLRVLFTTHLSLQLSERGEFERAETVLLALEEELDQVDLHSRARLHWSLASAASGQGKRRIALRHMRSALQLLKGTEDTERLARAHMACASIVLWAGRTRGASEHLLAARSLLPGAADPVIRSQLLSLEALLLARRGEMDAARATADEALGLVREPGTTQAAALYAAALAAGEGRDFVEADNLFERVLDLRLKSNLWREAANVALDRAAVRFAAGDSSGGNRWRQEAAMYEANAAQRKREPQKAC